MPSPQRRSRSTQPPTTEPLTPATTMQPVEVATSAIELTGPGAMVGQRNAESGWRAMVEYAADALVAADQDGCMVRVNRQTEVLFGYAREELLGQPVEMLIAPRFHSAHQQDHTQYLATARARPMESGSKVIGRRRDGSEFPMEMRLGSFDDEDVEDRDQRLVIYSIREMSELQRIQVANGELLAVQAVADIARAHLAPDDLLPALLERVLAVMGVDHAAVLLLEAEGQQLTMRMARGVGLEERALQVRAPVGQGFAGRIAATRQPRIVDELSIAPDVDPLLRERVHSAIGVPLIVGNRLVGVLQAGTVTARTFGDADVRVLELMGAWLARDIDHTRLLEAEQEARQEAERERVRWQATMDSTPEYVATCDANLRMTYVNPAYAQLRGSLADPTVPPEERAERYGLLASDGTGYLPPEQRPLTRALLEGEAVHGVEMVHRNPTGEERRVVWEAAPMRSPQGTLLGAVAIGHDITERTRLEREREEAHAEAERQAAQLETMFEAMADGVAVYDSQGRLMRENAAQQRLLGVDAAPPDYAALALHERMALFAARDAKDHPLAQDEGPLPRALRGEVVGGAEAMDFRSRTLDGREVELNVSAAPLRDREGRLTGAVAIFRDQTERKRLERERDEQAEQLDRIFEGIADGLVVYNAQGRPIRLNAAARRILGLDAATVAAIATSEYAQLSAPDRAVLYEARDEQGRPLAPEEWPLIRVLRGQVTGADTREVRLRMLDGREVDVTTSAAPLHDQAGHLVGAVTILHDQTERNRLRREGEEALRRSEAWFHTMADTAPVLLWVSDTDGLVTFVNDPWLQFTGRRMDQEMGNGWAEGVHPDDYVRCLETYRTAFGARERFTMEYRLRRFDGAYRWILDSGVPRFDADGSFAGYIGSAIDVTEREQLKREREEARAHELALQDTARHMDEFLAIASHDLRTPLTVVKSQLQLALRRFERLRASAEVAQTDAQTDTRLEGLNESLQLANQGAERLTRFTALLFDVARARSGALELRFAPCDVAAVVREQVAMQQTTSPRRTLQVVLPDILPVVVRADADRLSQVLSNYLSNALKYSAEDQPVAVRLEVAGGEARVAVCDAGPGLPEAELSRIWEPFHRAPGVEVRSSEDVGSLGLGLHICRSIVELHRGSVGVDSQVGEGSTFWFSLPLSEAMD